MSIINIIIENIITIYSSLIYLSFITGAAILEVFYLKKHSRKAFVLLCTVFILSGIMFCTTLSKHDATLPSFETIEIKEGTDVIGFQQVAINENKKLIYIGKFITNQDTNTEYLDISVKNGMLQSKKKDFSNLGNIETALFSHGISFEEFTGESLNYTELKRNLESTEKRKYAAEVFSLKFIYAFFPSISILSVYLLMKYRNKKRNMLKKMKLTDL